MFGNNYVTCLSLTGMVVLTLGTVMGLIGLATIDWILFDADSLDTSTNFYSTLSRYYGTDGSHEPVSFRVGLWQICIGLQAEAPECTTSERIDNVTEVTTLRILMLLSLIGLAVGVLYLLCFSFRENCHSRLGCRMCVSLVVGLSVTFYLLIVIAITLIEYSSPDGYFADELGTNVSVTLGWSFIVSLVGALINPIGLFFLCTSWHFTDDAEAGVRFNYDEKRIINNNNAV